MGVKPVIAFVTGGYSSEAVISYKSAVTIEQNLDTNSLDVSGARGRKVMLIWHKNHNRSIMQSEEA